MESGNSSLSSHQGRGYLLPSRVSVEAAEVGPNLALRVTSSVPAAPIRAELLYMYMYTGSIRE